MKMTIEQINDLAFKFVSDKEDVRKIFEYFLHHNGDPKEVDYFGVFINHWLRNEFDLNWADAVMTLSFDMEKYDKDMK